MITHVYLENFKGVGKPFELELRPITLLFGANSAGKSTVADALSFLADVFATNTATPEIFQTSSGRATFLQLVHEHDSGREMTLGVRCSLAEGDESYFSLYSESEDEDEDGWRMPTSAELNFGCELESISLRITFGSRIAHSDGGLVNSAEFRRFQVCVNDQPFADLVPTHRRRGRLTEVRWECNLNNSIIPDDISAGETTLSFTNSALNVFPFASVAEVPLESGFISCIEEGDKAPTAGLMHYLNALILGVFRVVNGRLIRFRRVGALRIVPSLNFTPTESASSADWEDGLAAWGLLAHCGEDSLIEVNVWLGPEHLDTGYQVRQLKLVDILDAASVSRLSPNITPEELQRRIELQASSIRRVQFFSGDTTFDFENKALLNPREVGTGVSQVIPVVVACCETRISNLLWLSQPELHLHPRCQAVLGDLMIYAYRWKNHQLIVETHSEHLILRLLRRIRETAKGELDQKERLNPHELSIYHISRTNGNSVAKSIDVDLNGEFIQPWPDDFFEIDFYERFT